MKRIISIAAIMGLSACMGSGGGGGGSMTPASTEPEPAVTNSISAAMSGTRSNSLSPVFYNTAVGRVAQDHAQDMVDRGYTSIFDRDTTGCAGPMGQCDMGDDLNTIRRNWDEIVQMVAEGDKSVPVVFQEFRDRTNGNNVGDGDLGFKLNEALTLPEFEQYEFFGLGKAGTGSNTRWAFIFVAPREDWSDRLP